MPEWRHVADYLQPAMTPGKRYEIADLISLLLTTEYKITPEGKTPYKDQKTPRWHRWVRNAVRESPDRTNHKGSGWPELRGENVGPSIGDWEYWIEKEENISIIEENISQDELSTIALNSKIKQLETLTESAAPGRPVENDGWLAEQRAMEYLEKKGWKCFDVSRAAVGFDILARRSDGDIYVEVKSSTSLLKSISLTENEWRAAMLKRDKYWIAFFDHFDSEVHEPTGWLKDPAKIIPTVVKTTEYNLPRSKWVQ